MLTFGGDHQVHVGEPLHFDQNEGQILFAIGRIGQLEYSWSMCWLTGEIVTDGRAISKIQNDK
jgi:hypothetical protein